MSAIEFKVILFFRIASVLFTNSEPSLLPRVYLAVFLLRLSITYPQSAYRRQSFY